MAFNAVARLRNEVQPLWIEPMGSPISEMPRTRSDSVMRCRLDSFRWGHGHNTDEPAPHYIEPRGAR
jgi:hypothetical protein